MSYRKQKTALATMERESQKGIDRVVDDGFSNLATHWRWAKDHMGMAIASEYRTHHPDRWSHPDAASKGTIIRMDRNIGFILDLFQRESVREVKKRLAAIYRNAALRQTWMIDMITPPSLKVQLPMNKQMQEAVRMGGNMGDWETRWEAWISAYRANLYNNLRMSAINESSLTDAVDKIDTTKAGSPSFDVGDALGRIYLTMAISSANEAILDTSRANKDFIQEEVWQTRYDERICDECEDNRGLTPEEASDTIPLHPNCRCYWRVVPKSWADLLKRGTADDYELARRIDAAGIMPSSMVIRDKEGGLSGALMISFEKWMDGQTMGIKAAA